MDISKIINDSIDQSMKEIFNGKFNNYSGIDDENTTKSMQQDIRLMNYTNILLKTYHKELQKELSNHGIEI